MKFSLIIPTLNAARRLERLFQALNAQTRRPDQILVVDSSSEDGTPDLAKRLGAEVISVSRATFDHGGTRTAAGRYASGDILVYMTDDAVPASVESLERLLKVFKIPGVGAAYGRQLPHNDAGVFGRMLREFNYPATSYLRVYEDRTIYGVKTPFLSNSFAAYSRDALEEIGWFKDNLILGEDFYAGGKMLAAGYKLGYVADAVVNHSHNYSPWADFKRYFDIGVFHRRENWLLKEFGKAEGEGLRFVRQSVVFLWDNHSPARIPEFFWRTALKYLGYKLGSQHELLPAFLRKRFSMHSNWWK